MSTQDLECTIKDIESLNINKNNKSITKAASPQIAPEIGHDQIKKVNDAMSTEIEVLVEKAKMKRKYQVVKKITPYNESYDYTQKLSGARNMSVMNQDLPPMLKTATGSLPPSSAHHAHAHAPGAPPAKTGPTSSGQPPVPRKFITFDKLTNVCFSFQNQGYCMKNERCRFDHLSPELCTCIEWSKFHGHCTRGMECRFAHLTPIPPIPRQMTDKLKLMFHTGTRNSSDMTQQMNAKHNGGRQMDYPVSVPNANRFERKRHDITQDQARFFRDKYYESLKPRIHNVYTTPTASARPRPPSSATSASSLFRNNRFGILRDSRPTSSRGGRYLNVLADEFKPTHY